jgi:DNA-binding NtrC family response regulator
VLWLELPPLRDRRSDIPLLTSHFVAKHTRSLPAPMLSPAATQALHDFSWPGNIRELENAVVRALHLAEGGVIETQHLGLMVESRPAASTVAWFSGAHLSFKEGKRRIVDAFEREYLARVIAESQGNITRAALVAQKERRELGKLLKKHGLKAKDFSRIN